MADYPFRFYGAQPDGWDTTEIEQPTYLIMFRREPSDKHRTSLAKVLKERLAEHELSESAGSWEWDGRTAGLRFVDDDLAEESDDWDTYKELVREFVCAIHETNPIEEVVFVNADPDECDDDEWTQWSLEQQEYSLSDIDSPEFASPFAE